MFKLIDWPKGTVNKSSITCSFNFHGDRLDSGGKFIFILQCGNLESFNFIRLHFKRKYEYRRYFVRKLISENNVHVDTFTCMYMVYE